MSRPREEISAEIARRIRAVQKEICTLGYISKGIVVRTYVVCGKATCHCARKGDRRHGPYYVWSRIEKGQLVRTSLSPQRARRLATAIRQHRNLNRLLRKWEATSWKGICMNTS